MQTKLQGHDGAVKRIVVNVPHTVTDNGVPHQLPRTSKLVLFSCLHCLMCSVLYGSRKQLKHYKTTFNI